MSAPATRFLGILTRESLSDAVRRRIVAAVAALALLSLWFVESCTSCTGGSYTVNDTRVDPSTFAGFSGMLLYGLIALWTVVLAGLLSSDHLAQTLEDGSAELVLARPVSRASFALSRLIGALIITFATGGVLLGATAFFLAVRHGLGPGPALLAAGASALACVVVGGLAMAASLWLPRLANFLLVLVFVVMVATANGMGLAGAELGTVSGLIDRLGPPIGAGIGLAVLGWTELEVASGPFWQLVLRLGLWAAGSVVLLCVLFDRVELRRS